MAQDRLHVDESEHWIIDHAGRRGVAQIVQGVIRAEQGVRAHQHRPRRVIVQRPVRASQRVPDQAIGQPTLLGGLHQIQRQPRERIRRSGHLGQLPTALGDDLDGATPSVDIDQPHPE